MSRSTIFTATEVGEIALAIKTCDYCKAAMPDDRLGWFTVERDVLVVGEWEQLDFCSHGCLKSYFQDYAALGVAMGLSR